MLIKENMQSLENRWRDPINLTLHSVINTATNGVPKYHDAPSRVGYEPTRAWCSIAQRATIEWIREQSPDVEDLRSSLETIIHSGNNFGCSGHDLELIAYHNDTKLRGDKAYNQLLIALETRKSDSLCYHHFGDAAVTVPYEHISSIPLTDKDRAWPVALSNGCPIPRDYLSRIESEGITIPSMHYQPRVVREINHYFDDLSPVVQTFVWDYARANKLFQYLAEIISTENPALFRELMHSREELPDNKEATLSLPHKVNGHRLVRFMALSHPYPAISKIWERFDANCQTGHYTLAERTFDQDLARLITLIPQTPSLIALETSFLANL